MGWAYTLSCNFLGSSYHFLCLYHVCCFFVFMSIDAWNGANTNPPSLQLLYKFANCRPHCCRVQPRDLWSKVGRLVEGRWKFWDAYNQRTFSIVCWIIWPFMSETDVFKHIMVHPKKFRVDKQHTIFSSIMILLVKFNFLLWLPPWLAHGGSPSNCNWITP